jgi:hypothetical protein
MRKIGKYSLLFVTAAFLCAATLSVSAYSFQVAHSPMQAFAGTWKAVHEGKTIMSCVFISTKNRLPAVSDWRASNWISKATGPS